MNGETLDCFEIQRVLDDDLNMCSTSANAESTSIDITEEFFAKCASMFIVMMSHFFTVHNHICKNRKIRTGVP